MAIFDQLAGLFSPPAQVSGPMNLPASAGFPMPAAVPPSTPFGALSPAVPPSTPGGMMANLKAAMQNNPTAILAIAAGLASGKTMPESLSKAFAGASAGMQLDEQAAERRRKATQALKKQQAALRLAGDDEQMKLLAEADPDTFVEAKISGLKPADMPAAIQGYNLAVQQGYTGTFLDYQRDLKEAGAMRIENVGNIPAGYELYTDPQTGARRMQPIPGSPAALEHQQAQEQAEQRRQQQQTSGDIVVQDIDRSLEMIEASPATTTGIGGAILSNIPGTTARNVDALIGTIKANAAFDKLQAMREASPTGGALGQVSDRELARLEAAIGNLELSQSAEQLRENLKRVKNVYLDIIHGEGNGPPRERLSFEAPQAAAGAQSLPINNNGQAATPPRIRIDAQGRIVE